MNFDLNDEQVMFRNMAREFGEREITPTLKEDDRTQTYRPEIIKKMAPLGLLGAPMPQEYGGLGVDHVCYGVICEEIARASASVFTTSLTVHTSLFQLTLLEWCSDEQKQKYFPKTTQGELMGCFALTEPNTGSDAASMEAAAVLSGNSWVLNGSKMWISSGGISDLSLVFAQSDKEKKHRGIVAFLVEKGTNGFTTRDIHDKLGLRVSNTSQLIFQDCAVPAENVVGKVGDGFKIAMYALDNARYSTACACVGVSQAALDASVAYAQERTQFGKPIGGFQLIQEMIADMVIETEASRFLTYRVGHLKNEGRKISRESAMAKYYASEVALRVTGKAIKVHGGYGYSNDYPVERYYRDAMGLALYEGTSEIQKLVIGRETLGIAAFV